MGHSNKKKRKDNECGYATKKGHAANISIGFSISVFVLAAFLISALVIEKLFSGMTVIKYCKWSGPVTLIMPGRLDSVLFR